MARRMDRYYKDELVEPGRSKKNQSLYEQIENLDTYSNIEGVATIEKTNEIDISKVQEMIKNRENYKKQRQFSHILKEEKQEVEEPKEVYEETKNYDIKDILSKLEENDLKKLRSRRLNENQVEELKNIKNIPKNYDIEKEESELKELINTMTINKNIEEDDVGLLDNLKSDTMVGTAASIKKIIDSEREKKLEETKSEIDNSFYTSSLGFTRNDFEELKDMNHSLKKSNKFIIVLLIVLTVLLIGAVLFFILK